jgi:hypothetical protein
MIGQVPNMAMNASARSGASIRLVHPAPSRGLARTAKSGSTFNSLAIPRIRETKPFARRFDVCCCTGLRSRAGRKRASRSSNQHRLGAETALGPEGAKRIELLAGKIVGADTGVVAFECARAAAQADFDLATIRRIKVAVIEQPGMIVQAADCGSLKSLKQLERDHEAVRQALAELIKLDRYGRRPQQGAHNQMPGLGYEGSAE